MLRIELGNLGPLDRAGWSKRLPVVLSRDQMRCLFAALFPGLNRLFALLLCELYEGGLRFSEALRLRAKEAGFRSRSHPRAGRHSLPRTRSGGRTIQELPGREQLRTTMQ
jgi:site-specific recombinase XerD